MVLKVRSTLRLSVTETESRRVLTFYRFVRVASPARLQQRLQTAGERLALKGTVLLAAEGINGTLAGAVADLTAFQQELARHFDELPYKWSDLEAGNPGFHRLKIRVKPEIVSFGVPDLDVHATGRHVDAGEWHELLEDPEVTVIDTRNQYEVDIGTFPGAVSPRTTNFREFPQWVKDNLDPAAHKRVAMFCTGGIRCEKASAYMLAAGFDEVYQLNGGILKYLEDTRAGETRWSGECFVFDQRVSVDPQLQQGRYQQCFACRHPLSEADMASADFEQGVSCPHCSGRHSSEQTQNLRERQKQVLLAERRGSQHIGKPMK